MAWLVSVALAVALAPGTAAAQTVYVSSERDDLTLWELAGTSAMPVMVGSRPGMVFMRHYERLCGIPCSVDLGGTGELALSIDGGTPVPVRSVRVPFGGELVADYDNRTGIRIAGWLTLALGAAFGGVLAGTSVVTGPTVCSGFSGYCHQEINVEQLIAGSVIVGLAIAVGLALGLLGDGAWLRPASGRDRGHAAVEDDEPEPPRAARGPSLPRTWSDVQIRDLLSASHDAVVACFEGDRAEARVELTLGTAGRVTAGHVLDGATATETACFQRVLASIAVPATVASPRTVRLRFSRSAAEDAAEETEAGAGAEAESTPPAPAPAERDVAAEVRAILTARAGSILACVDGATVAVTASWAADGTLTIGLRGERAGSPEDGCVAAAFAGVLLDPPPSASGSLVHPVAGD